MAQVINNSLLRLRPKTGHVEIPLLRFLADLNNMAHSYKELFQFTETDQLFDVEFLDNTLKNSRFSSISCIKDDVLQLEVSPKEFHALLTSIIVDASIKRSKTLIREINQLRSQYTTASLEPAIKLEPELPAQSLVESQIQSDLISVPLDNPSVDSTLTNINDIHTDKVIDRQDSTIDQLQIRDLRSIAATDGYSDSAMPNSKDSNLPQTSAETGSASSTDEILLTNGKTDQLSVEKEEVESCTEVADKKEDQVVEKIQEAEVIASDKKSPSPDLSELTDVVKIGTDAIDVTGEVLETIADFTEQEADTIDKLMSPIEKSSENQAIEAFEPKNMGVKKETDFTDLEEEGEGAPKRSRTRNQLAQKRSVSPLGTQASHKHKRFQSIAINLLRSIEGHRFSSPFLLPVTAPNYSDTVKEATDLKTIMKALKSKQEPPVYETLKELERDIMLMFANCVMFNKSKTPIVDMAREMKSEVSQTFKMFEEAESNLNQ